MTHTSAERLTQLSWGSFWITTLALLCACALSVASWLNLCSQACAEGHSYRIFGLTFETVGMTVFPLITLGHLVTRFYHPLLPFIGWCLCATLGAEVVFIYLQKYKIGSWCPVCLSIAACLAVAAFPYLYSYFKVFKKSLEHPERGQIMHNIYRGLTGLGFFIIGFLIAFVGVVKENRLQAAENNIKDTIAFGNNASQIEVYIFTDWACPACRALEPNLEKIVPKVMSKARVTFVDDPIHPETLNYTPYNVSFMIHNKSNYFTLRRGLSELSKNTKEPSDQQITAIATKAGQQYKQLNYADVALANKYFTHLVSTLNVDGTPTVVVVNKNTQQGKKFSGSKKITEENILKAIQTLSKD